MAINTIQQRNHKDFVLVVRKIQSEYLKKGKNPPSYPKITKMLAKKIIESELLKNEIIIIQ
jgi:hypothetical protein